MSLDLELELYAVPGERSIIDQIDPVTGLTCVYGRTEAEVLAREPRAVRMTWNTWRDAVAKMQQTPITWEPTTEKQYRDMLEVLPPAAWVAGAFLVGEPDDHCVVTGRPRFRAYARRGAGYKVGSRPLTVAEFNREIGR